MENSPHDPNSPPKSMVTDLVMEDLFESKMQDLESWILKDSELRTLKDPKSRSSEDPKPRTLEDPQPIFSEEGKTIITGLDKIPLVRQNTYPRIFSPAPSNDLCKSLQPFIENLIALQKAEDRLLDNLGDYRKQCDKVLKLVASMIDASSRKRVFCYLPLCSEKAINQVINKLSKEHAEKEDVDKLAFIDYLQLHLSYRKAL
jgi:hypothetical protein